MALRRELLLVSLLSVAALHAQTTFAPIGAKWTYKQGSTNGPDTSLVVIEALGDTVIAGRTCSSLSVTAGGFGCHLVHQNHHSANDSLYFWDEAASTFHLLFRWNAVPGDGWRTPITDADFGGAWADTLNWTVIDTSTIIVAGLPLRQLVVECMPQEWIWEPVFGVLVTERLGPMGAPFAWEPEICDGEYMMGLRCYEDPDITWQNPLYPQCELSTTIGEATISANISITPNPVERDGNIRISVPTDLAGTWVDVLDASGRLIVTSPMQSSAIELSLPTAGLYQVIARDSKGPYARTRVAVE